MAWSRPWPSPAHTDLVTLLHVHVAVGIVVHLFVDVAHGLEAELLVLVVAQRLVNAAELCWGKAQGTSGRVTRHPGHSLGPGLGLGELLEQAGHSPGPLGTGQGTAGQSCSPHAHPSPSHQGLAPAHAPAPHLSWRLLVLAPPAATVFGEEELCVYRTCQIKPFPSSWFMEMALLASFHVIFYLPRPTLYILLRARVHASTKQG